MSYYLYNRIIINQISFLSFFLYRKNIILLFILIRNQINFFFIYIYILFLNNFYYYKIYLIIFTFY